METHDKFIEKEFDLFYDDLTMNMSEYFGISKNKAADLIMKWLKT
jgi:hypothetical protein